MALRRFRDIDWSKKIFGLKYEANPTDVYLLCMIICTARQLKECKQTKIQIINKISNT